MKKLSLLSLFAYYCFCGFAQSSESIKEKYPDDMYTKINGKEVRVNTLPKKVIDSLESLPPHEKMLAIYKVEKTETHAVTNKPTEVYDISEFDRWLDKNVDRTYKVYRNGDGTTRIEDNSGNWMLFNTEYKVNEYTGEKSTTPIDGKLYCGFNGKKKVVLLGAYRVLPNGYKLDVDGYNKTITMTYMPLGVSYTVRKNRILSDIWYEWQSEDGFLGSFNNLFNKKSGDCVIKGPDNNELVDCTNFTFKNIVGFNITGGLYCKKTHYMYYVHRFGKSNNNYDYHNGYVMKVHPINDEAEKNLDSYILQNSQEEASLITQNSVNKMTLAENRNELIKLRKVRDQLKKDYDLKQAAYQNKHNKPSSELNNEFRNKYNSITQEIKKRERISHNVSAQNKATRTSTTNYNVQNVLLLPCIPTDNIKEVKLGEKVSEMYYANGDYIKFSKIKAGEVFDCKIHRPNGLWTVSLVNNNPVSNFEFTKGQYKGLCYKD